MIDVFFARDRSSIATVLTAIVISILLFSPPAVHGFVAPGGVVGTTLASSRAFVPSVELSSSAASGDNEGSETATYPALSRKEIEAWMATVPAYTITDSDTGGVILLEAAAGTDEDSSVSTVAYFFLTKEMADGTLSELKRSNVNGGKMAVSTVDFGKLYFDMLHRRQKGADGSASDEEDDDGVEYRLVPDPRDLRGARTIQSNAMEQQQQRQPQSGGTQSGDTTFQSAFNEIPVFMELQIRFEEDDGDGNSVERFPMYLGLQDLVKTCQQFLTSTEGTFEAAINVAELESLVEQMQHESNVDFRKALLIPPTPQPLSTD